MVIGFLFDVNPFSSSHRKLFLLVALSRVRSRQGLSLKYPVGIQQIKADPIVLQFYAKLKQFASVHRNNNNARIQLK